MKIIDIMLKKIDNTFKNILGEYMQQVLQAIGIILFFSAILTGCGGDATKSLSSANTPHKIIIKENRALWQEVNRPAESSLGVLEKSLDNGILEFNLKKGTRVGEYFQFYIDVDNNNKTGYKRSGKAKDVTDGADYLFEEDRLYKSTANGEGWNWEYIGSITFNKIGDYVYASSTADIMGEIDSNFRVGVLSIGAQWETVSFIKMRPFNLSVVTVDGNPSEWANIPLWANSDFGDIKIIDDVDNLYFLVENGNLGSHTQIYINSDNDPNTGYINNLLGEQSGADYMIEDDRLYKATANGGWSWELISYVDYARDGNTIEIAVLKSLINIENADAVFQVGAIGWSADYNNIITFMTMKSTSQQNIRPLVISEVMAVNAHTILDPDFFSFSDWIEIHNQTDNPIDIGNYALSDKIDEAKWTIPANTTIEANGYMLFWADGKDSSANAHHTNFKLKSKGEEVALFDSNGVVIDSFKFNKQHSDISCSKNQDGDIVYMFPTPAESNKIKHGTLEDISQKPIFSKQGGFYNQAQSISLSAENGGKIYYTIDGSLPTKESFLYDGVININETKVIRTRALEEGGFYSDMVSNTYFINETSSLPVISISMDAKYLWDDMIGIYTIGANGVENCGISANYMQRWERPAHIEYFDKNRELGFSQGVDIKISGDCSRKRAQKSLSIEASDKYGKKSIKYKLFAEKSIDEFKSFRLRSSGQDWGRTMFRDAFIQRLIKDDLDIDYQAYEPSIVFINGKYWGIHNIREKKNEDFLASNYPDLNSKKVDILYGYYGVKEGKEDDYTDLIYYIKNNSLSSDANYNYITQKIDINNFIDYQIAQIYISNFDWPANNIRYWKEQKDGAKWRWMMDDQDVGFNVYSLSYSDNPEDFGISHNTLESATSENSNPWHNPPWSTFVFRNLLANENFENAFVMRYNTLLTSTFSSLNAKTLINDMAAAIEDDMPRSIERWSSEGSFVDMNRWHRKVQGLRDFARERPAIAKEHLDQMFPLYEN